MPDSTIATFYITEIAKGRKSVSFPDLHNSQPPQVVRAPVSLLLDDELQRTDRNRIAAPGKGYGNSPSVQVPISAMASPLTIECKSVIQQCAYQATGRQRAQAAKVDFTHTVTVTGIPSAGSSATASGRGVPSS